YMKEQGLFRTDASPEAEYSELLTLDLSTIEPSLAGPKRPQDRVRLSDVKAEFESALDTLCTRMQGPGPRPQALGRLEAEGGQPAAPAPDTAVMHEPYAFVHLDGEEFTLEHG